ncbi:cytochrome c oxidase subunit 2 [Zea mays]|uniref:Cytochrome c oxidase polypeptide II n=1 Tax=Zea mays TaxID=4577 RepID=A0A3L6FYN5_MAIZE|nr:cytochrome c oxidase subunit 2 [Zea mays]
MDQSSLLSLLGAELKKMELSSTMIFLLTDRKMLLSSSKPIMIATRGMPGIPLNRESESVEDVHRVLRALPLFREMEGILRERNLNLPSVQEISAFRVNLFSGIRRESAIADYDAFWRSLLEEIHTPQGRSCFGQRIQDLHARMSAEGNWDYLIAQQGRGYFGNLPNLNSPLDQYQFGIHPILDLNIAVAYNFGPKGRPRYLSEWGIPVGNNHGSSCGTTGPREDNLLFLLLLLRFGDGGPTVGKSTHKHLAEGDQRFYSSTEEPFLREARDVVNGGSYTIPEDDPELGQSRLLEVDNRVVVPAKTHLRMIVTPADVPHSWAVPSSGVKCDAVPGRSNLTSISVQREGVYYGQCSEICGTNHAFTPIVVEAVTLKDYADWKEEKELWDASRTRLNVPGFYLSGPQVESEWRQMLHAIDSDVPPSFPWNQGHKKMYLEWASVDFSFMGGSNLA